MIRFKDINHSKEKIKKHSFLLKKLERSLLKNGLNSHLTQNILKISIEYINNRDFYDYSNFLSFIKFTLIRIIEKYVTQIDIDVLIKPNIMLICGLNGTGKTTIAIKMANLLTKLKWKVGIVSCDKFRPGAEKQLELFAKNINSLLIKTESDKSENLGSLTERSIITAKEKGVDVLILDTAGRTNNNINLMLELKKIKNIAYNNSSINHVIFALDANSGYGIIDEIREFHKILNITGIVITKAQNIKSTGILFSIIDELKIPIHGITYTQDINDLQDFIAEDFVNVLIKEIDV